MSNLLVIVFDDETTAFDARSTLAKIQKEYLIEMECGGGDQKREGRD